MYGYRIAATNQLLNGADMVVPPSEHPEQPMEIEEYMEGSNSTFLHGSPHRFRLSPEPAKRLWEGYDDLSMGVSSMHLSDVGQTGDDDDAIMVENILAPGTPSDGRSPNSSVQSSPLLVGPSAPLLGLHKLIPSTTPPRLSGLRHPPMPQAPRKVSHVFAPSESPQSSGSSNRSLSSPPPSPTNRRMDTIFSQNPGRDLSLKLSDFDSQEQALGKNKRLIGNAGDLHSMFKDASQREKIKRQSTERALAWWKAADAMDIPQ